MTDTTMTPDQIAHRERIVAEFTAEFREKYNRGQREHGGNFWLKDGVLDFAIEEALDLVAYLFTLREQMRRQSTCVSAQVASDVAHTTPGY